MICRTTIAGVTWIEGAALFLLGAVSVACSGSERDGRSSNGVAESVAENGEGSGSDEPNPAKAVSVEDRLAAEEHAGAAAVGGLVDGGMLAGGPVAEVPGVDFDETGVDRFLEQALLEIAVEEVREDGEDVETHRRSPAF